MYNNREYNPTHITTGTTAQIFTGKGILHNIVVNTSTGTAVAMYDSIGANTGTIAILKSSISEGTYSYDATVANGLYITHGTGDYTVLWTRG